MQDLGELLWPQNASETLSESRAEHLYLSEADQSTSLIFDDISMDRDLCRDSDATYNSLDQPVCLMISA